ncbi:MAG TPA: hypothetical protein DEA44_16980 [Firmicutes bacterium]|jgi:DNA-binding LytR/AlgR family response regulator|nr:hypothetical protein [Bacillota bacterium]
MNLSKGGEALETPLKVAVCEDLAEDAALLLQCIYQSGIPADCAPFSSGEELLAAFSPGRYDLIFMDIYMPGMRGVEAAAVIRREDDTVTLAFTTTSPDHTLESYRLGALKYLEKPVTVKDVRETLELARMKRRSAAYISLLISGEKREIPLDGIFYFEQQNHSVAVNTAAGVLRTSQTVKLNAIEPLLPDTFLRCHHSYIANLRYVRGVDQELKTFTMKNGDKVYIRRQDIKKAAKAYEDYLFRTARGSGV